MDLKKIMALAMMALMVIPSFGMALGQVTFTVKTDRSSYEPGEDVEISGTADPNANITIIVIFNATQNTVLNETILAEDDGNYSREFTLPIDAYEGIYNVTACNVTEAETFFNVVQPEPPDEDTAVGLRCAIKRAYIFIEKIEATVERLVEKGYVVQNIEANLTEAKIQLEEVERLLDSLDFDAAEQEFLKAREILGSIMGWVHSTAKKVKVTRAEKFMEQFQRQIQGVNGTLLRLQERLGEDVTASARGVLTSSMNRLKQLRRRVDAKMGDTELDAVLDDLDELVGEMVSDFGGMIRGNGKGNQNKGKGH